MLKFFPIESPIVRADLTVLLKVKWMKGKLEADFIMPGDDKYQLRVSFNNVEIIRVLDEMPLSTEEDWTSGSGHIPGHFAYRMENAHFWLSQSEAFRLAAPNLNHYSFLTCADCLDVIASDTPNFSFVSAD